MIFKNDFEKMLSRVVFSNISQKPRCFVNESLDVLKMDTTCPKYVEYLCNGGGNVLGLIS